MDVKVDHTLRVRTPEFREHLAAVLEGRADGVRLLESVDQLIHEKAPPIITESVPMTATMVANRLEPAGHARRAPGGGRGHGLVDGGAPDGLALAATGPL